MPIDLSAQTEPGHHWSCSACSFSTRSLAFAMQHCEEESGDYPAHEHTLHELPPDTTARNRARRVISCRFEDKAVEPRVTRSNWRFLDGAWELPGIVGRRAA